VIHHNAAFRVYRIKAEVRATRKTIILGRARKDGLERGDNGRVELSFNRLSQAQARHATRHCIAVRTIRRHGVVGVGNGNDPR
jgi:hypothetical protein